MPLRPIAQRVWAGTTSTGSSTAVFGLGHRYLGLIITNPTTKAFVLSAQVSAGYSTGWITVLNAATSTGANVSRMSTGGVVFDRARVVVTTNDTTNGAAKVWAIANG